MKTIPEIAREVNRSRQRVDLVVRHMGISPIRVAGRVRFFSTDDTKKIIDRFVSSKKD